MALIITVGAIVAGSLVVLSGVQTGSNTKLIVPPITNYTQGYEYAKQEFYGANISCPFELSGKLTGPIPKQGNKYGEGAVKYQDRTIGYMNSLECNKIFRDENGKVKAGKRFGCSGMTLTMGEFGEDGAIQIT